VKFLPIEEREQRFNELVAQNRLLIRFKVFKGLFPNQWEQEDDNK
jgi:hypothetical protein